ncbi:hypothetical protein MTZ49_05045 [Entomomonas sp. E2T0]|uniref:hypothetical protein n=1 Tax=Entomomonas sp. E2T0 TaxID=2930213 RepID=UPI0022284DDD|nr:hypothetical protein [Entomomonas sp. E2T0]UYZ84933.1 hypothetical protein MTZ49_05045 [Entomomonas sp. E2T0]
MKLIAQASTTEMKAVDWGLDNWFDEQINVTNNYQTNFADDPKLTYQQGPLRESIIRELAFKSICEYEATKGLLLLADKAPNYVDFDYLLTQIFDEGVHAKLFREHLIRIGFSSSKEVAKQMEDLLQDHLKNIITPLRAYFDKWVTDKNNYLAGVLIITVVLEGVLAPTSELSEVKWYPFDRTASAIQARANVDELRHLTVCANIVKEQIESDNTLKAVAHECINEGLALWHEVSFSDFYVERETLYQQGMEQHKSLIEGYELYDGLLLSESTVESRLELSNYLVNEMQQSRLKYMGLL